MHVVPLSQEIMLKLNGTLFVIWSTSLSSNCVWYGMSMVWYGSCVDQCILLLSPEVSTLVHRRRRHRRQYLRLRPLKNGQRERSFLTCSLVFSFSRQDTRSRVIAAAAAVVVVVLIDKLDDANTKKNVPERPRVKDNTSGGDNEL